MGTSDSSCDSATGIGESLSTSNSVSHGPPPLHDDDPFDQPICPGPPPVTCQIASEAIGRALPASVEEAPRELKIVERKDSHKESASWISSVVIHAVILVFLTFVFAPTDFGGVDIIQLYVTMSDHEPFEPRIAIMVPEEQPVAVENSQPSTVAPQPVVAPVIVPAAIAKEDIFGDGASDASVGNASPRGSFFGIEANGHDFVYVLDVSGSMKGSRYWRASAELKHSVKGLDESQKFYVFLFSGNVTQMFGESKILPKTIAATPENKRRLARWLENTSPGGSTDPRPALKTALRMNPSAIFMLSDGEFDEQTNRKRHGITGGSTDTFAIVEAAGGSVPINAIAFEDPRSCANMQRLSEMTGGEYRFADARDDREESIKSFRLAEQVLETGDESEAVRLLIQTFERYKYSDGARLAARKLATIFATRVNESRNQGRDNLLKKTLASIVRLDPRSVETDDLQRQLARDVLRPGPFDSKQTESDRIEFMKEIVKRYPGSAASAQFRAPLAEFLFAKAQQQIADDPVAAVSEMQEIKLRFPKTSVARKCANEQTEAIKRVVAATVESRRTKGDSAYAQKLRELATAGKGTPIESTVNRLLEKLGFEMLAAARNASADGDQKKRDQIYRQIDENLGGLPQLERMRRDFATRESRARSLLGQGRQSEKRSEKDRAIEIYTEIVDEYGETFAAKIARLRMEPLRKELDEQARMDAELAQMFETTTP